jgi:hypothetical protein
MRTDFRLWLVCGGKKTPQPIASTSVMRMDLKYANEPMHRHIALTKKTSEMLVMWTSAAQGGQMVKYGASPGNYTQTAAAISSTYGRDDLCGEPATSDGWWHPGWMHRALITGLPLAKPTAPSSSISSSSISSLVYYTVGSHDGGWSPEASFSPPLPVGDPHQPVNLLITADVGALDSDGFHTHWSGPDTQERQSNLTWEHLTKAPQADVLMIYGDLSYATGYLAKWELFMTQIEGVASRTAYMSAQGNHERDWPGTGSVGGKDSGGECGLPVQARFTMPTPSKKQESGWYSVDIGSVHHVMIDTELPCGEGSEQYEWLTADLSTTVNRSLTPWVFFGGHRPMYHLSGTGFVGPDRTKNFCDGAKDVEPLLMKYKVDLALWGHVHNAMVTCPVYNASCVKPTHPGAYDAPVHVVVGNGGQVLSGVPTHHAPWTRYQANEWGWEQIFVHNATHLTMHFSNDVENALHYSFDIVRNFPRD